MVQMRWAVSHSLEHSWKRRLLSQLPGYAECHQTLETNGKVMPGTAAHCLTHRSTWKNGEARYSGTLFNTVTDRWNDEKGPAVSLYLKRITKLKCVNSEIKSNVESTAWKGIPLGVPTILSNRQEGHTCLEKLFELLTWNVSFVQNKTEHLAKKWYDSSVMSSEMDWSSSTKTTCRFLA